MSPCGESDAVKGSRVASQQEGLTTPNVWLTGLSGREQAAGLVQDPDLHVVDGTADGAGVGQPFGRVAYG